MFAAVKHTAAWRLARGFKRLALAPRAGGPLPPEQCRGTVELLDTPPAAEAGAGVPVRVRVTNRAGVPWPAAGPCPVRLRTRWRTLSGDPFGDPAIHPLPRPAFPGEPREFGVTVPAPGFVGDFTLEADLVQPGTGALAEHGDAAPARAAVPVVGRRATDIDYHAVYRNADLEANHWWVVGAYHSKEDYERSSRERVGMLRGFGLTPDSRLLDIGCGTGQLGGALDGFLSDRGAYYGTDIGAEAVAYCRRTFRRPNFVFRRGDMTTVPFAAVTDGLFDFAVFFSVFTHTFTDESALLLSEAARLLAPGGAVIADVIASPLVERGAGHRGEMVVNRDHFFRLAGMVGLSGEVVARWDWNRHAERLMLRFTRPHP